MKPGQHGLIVWGAWVLVLTGCGGTPTEQDTSAEVYLSIAAGTAPVVEKLAAAYERNTQVTVLCNFAASSTLAQQIERGAPADIYLSANQEWMDHLVEAGLIRTDSRIDLLGNRLVLVAPSKQASETAVEEPGDVAALLSGFSGRIATGDPGHVPVGMYAKAALQSLGLWDSIEPLIVPTKDVRSATLLVERGEVEMGIVYATEMVGSKSAITVATFPEDSHPPIHFSLALTAQACPEAEPVYRWLLGPESERAFRAAGFEFLGGAEDAL